MMNALKVSIAIATLAIGTSAQLPWEPCLGLKSQQCIGFDFSSFSASDFDTVGPGAWSRTSSGTLKVSAPASGSGATCERTGGSALTLKAGSSLPIKRTARARVRLSGGDGSIGFMFRRSNADNYGLMVAYTDSSCGGNTGGIVAGVARVSAFNHIKSSFVMGLPGITIQRDTWYVLSVDLVDELIRWRLQTENWMTGGGGAFFSDFVWGLLEDSAGPTGGGFGLYCSPGATCEFDDVVFYDTAVHHNLTGHLYCHYCTGVVWPVASADWCRCCQYSCGGANDDVRRACTANQGFCTQANRCQSTYDSDRGYPMTYCSPQVITSAGLPPTQPTVPGATTTSTRSPSPGATNAPGASTTTSVGGSVGNGDSSTTGGAGPVGATTTTSTTTTAMDGSVETPATAARMSTIAALTTVTASVIVFQM
jgi:hypothetical protein